MSRYARKVDGNQGEIVSALNGIGAQVIDMSGAGNGFPDLIVFFRCQITLIEIKRPKGKLTGAQVWFHAAARAAGVTIHIVRTVDEALALFGARVAA